MKDSNLHRHLIEALVLTLQEIFERGTYADKAIEKALKAHRKWGSRDRRFFAEQVYECVRWWRKYWSLLGVEPNANPNDILKVWAVHWLLKGNALPDWPELRGVRLDSRRVQEAQSVRAVRESVPDWLDEMGQSFFGGQWDRILKSLNESATVDLRVNSLKAKLQQVREELLTEGIESDPVEGLESALVLRERKNVFITKAFHAGHFEVQDRASQLVAPFLKVESGQRVVDACAGAGGKSLHIAALMKNKGKLVSMDISEWKLKELRTRASRNGVDVIETRVIDSSKIIKRMEKTADRVLLDVPCSGLGVLRRNPDTKWKLKPEAFGKILEIQSTILRDYSSMTKIGGRMVYATCSFLPSENEAQVEKFLAENPNWALEEQLRINPDQGRGDGFFAARLIRNP
jgi:16S rRNA (cytosine967-C5)-methyltransferase